VKILDFRSDRYRMRDPDMETLMQDIASKPRLYAVDARWANASRVGINGLPIPEFMLQLIAASRWVTKRVPGFPHPEFLSEQKLCLYGLHQMASENLYWPYETDPRFVGVDDRSYDPATINPSLSVLIGDFGLGSDQSIALDYRKSIADPPVVAMRWRVPVAANCWIEIAKSVRDFAAMVDL
jgi:hypothetical protein